MPLAIDRLLRSAALCVLLLPAAAAAFNPSVVEYCTAAQEGPDLDTHCFPTLEQAEQLVKRDLEPKNGRCVQ